MEVRYCRNEPMRFYWKHDFSRFRSLKRKAWRAREQRKLGMNRSTDSKKDRAKNLISAPAPPPPSLSSAKRTVTHE